ncbi:MAG: valine--tRNA ligase [Gammaproteobacteria bacterium]
MAKTYDPHAIEKKWYQWWERSKLFAPSGSGSPYCIMLPPPNVTGSLHMGHAFQDTLMDILIRFHRMRGCNTLWQCGTDHAGIATQMVVERQLAEQGKRSRQNLGRERFVDAVWAWKKQSGGAITEQLRRLGTSMDWSRERFTLDEGLSRAVTEVFCRLYKEGLVYRGKRLVNWDPVLHTAISDLEVVSQQEQGHLWHIRYPLANRAGHVVVATTRPETLLGDTALAVHPQDMRYQGLIDAFVELPLTGRKIPVIADEHVDPSFGSGCLKITPAHDFNDCKIGLRHGLPMLNVFTPDAKVNENGPPPYRGLDRYEARKRIVQDLQSQGLLEKVEDHRLMVPRGDRSHAVIEPYLTDQWFVRVEPLARPAIRAVEEGAIRFIPENWSKTYFEWMRNIQDWCISRQLWWGHRIPAWYDAEGKVYVGRSEQEVRSQHSLAGDLVLKQDPDVLDTWFSSALWPFSTLGWPQQSSELNTFYPTSVLVTGFDILFFWVARMIMMGLKFTGKVPFKEVYIHGLVRDADGQKMSKSKGNILDPIDLIDGIEVDRLVEKRTTGLMRPSDAPKIEQATRRQFPQGIPSYGTDALRFAFASLATQGRDIRFDLGRIEGHRNFCNKLWNAARYVLMATQNSIGQSTAELGIAERWILSRFEQAKEAVIEAITTYRFDLAVQALHGFTWDEYCDWYLEYSKYVLNDGKLREENKRATRQTLLMVLDELLRLLHPFLPFITEEIWSRLPDAAGMSIMTQPYPLPDHGKIDKAAIAEFDWVKTFILGVRRIRAEMNITSGKRLQVLVQGEDEQELTWLGRNAGPIGELARLDAIRRITKGHVSEAATALAGSMTILIPLADLIDPKEEAARLNKELDKLRQSLLRTEAKLANPSFLERAPIHVAEQERARRAESVSAIHKLEEQLRRIQSLEPKQAH